MIVSEFSRVVNEKYSEELLRNQNRRSLCVTIVDTFWAAQERRVFKMWLNEHSQYLENICPWKVAHNVLKKCHYLVQKSKELWLCIMKPTPILALQKREQGVSFVARR